MQKLLEAIDHVCCQLASETGGIRVIHWRDGGISLQVAGDDEVRRIAAALEAEPMELEYIDRDRKVAVRSRWLELRTTVAGIEVNVIGPHRREQLEAA